jgi:hypothetical protein
VETHKPHAVRTWTEFAAEVGMIVLGVLIALALGEAVQALRERSEASDARRNIRVEIAKDLGAMEVRAATEPCVGKRLDEILSLIKESESGHAMNAPLWIGHPAFYGMDDGEYRAEAQAGHLSLVASDEQAGYATIYDVFARYVEAEQTEQQAWANLRTLEQMPRISDAADWQLLSALQQARTARWTLEATAHAAGQTASRLGIAPEKRSRFKLQSVCVPLHTPRATALALVAKGRNTNIGMGGVPAAYDEP